MFAAARAVLPGLAAFSSLFFFYSVLKACTPGKPSYDSRACQIFSNMQRAF
jgi:hypothetical protein